MKGGRRSNGLLSVRCREGRGTAQGALLLQGCVSLKWTWQPHLHPGP